MANEDEWTVFVVVNDTAWATQEERRSGIAFGSRDYLSSFVKIPGWPPISASLETTDVAEAAARLVEVHEAGESSSHDTIFVTAREDLFESGTVADAARHLGMRVVVNLERPVHG